MVCIAAGQLIEGGCQVTEWGEFGPCSVTCGGGQRARLREAVNLDRNVGFVNCTALLVDFENCNTTGCPGKPIDEHLRQWSPFRTWLGDAARRSSLARGKDSARANIDEAHGE